MAVSAPLVSFRKKTCSVCKETKGISRFSASRQGVNGTVYRGNCKSCASKSAMQWFRDNPERNAENKLRFNLKKLYNVTLEQYRELLSVQNGSCAICNCKVDYNLAVDHDHNTGAVRGLLCHNCNRGIGLLGDDIDRIKKAVGYLERT